MKPTINVAYSHRQNGPIWRVEVIVNNATRIIKVRAADAFEARQIIAKHLAIPWY
jgi:hypothetical protein